MEHNAGRRADWIVALFLLCVSTALLVNVFYPSLLRTMDARLALHDQLLAGTAPAPHQYQMWLHNWVLDRVMHMSGSASPLLLTKVYAAYYAAGFLLAVILLYVLARTVGETSAAAASVLQFLAVAPLLWFDNYYHPGDPYGLALLALLTWCIIRQSTGALYLLLLLLSGFTWEKAVLVPLSVTGYQFITCRRRDWKTLVSGLVALGVAGIGQVLPRVLYGTERYFMGNGPAATVSLVLMSGMLIAAFFGPAMYQQFFARGEHDAMHRWLFLQFVLWLGIYFVVLKGPLTEMRSLLGLVPLLLPAAVAFYGRAQPAIANRR